MILRTLLILMLAAVGVMYALDFIKPYADNINLMLVLVCASAPILGIKRVLICPSANRKDKAIAFWQGFVFLPALFGRPLVKLFRGYGILIKRMIFF